VTARSVMNTSFVLGSPSCYADSNGN